MMPISPETHRPKVDIRHLVDRGAVLLDVRTEEEFVGFHLPGAVNIPYEALDDQLESVRRWKKPVLVYSAEGRRSSLATSKLRNCGVSAYDAGARDELFSCLS